MTYPLPQSFVFIRHAIAIDPEDFPGPDSERPLTRKGIKKAQKTFRVLSDLVQPTRIVASPFLRAHDTALLLREALARHGLEPAIETVAALVPEGDWAGWQTALVGLQPTFLPTDVVAVVGHEPSLGQLFARHLGLDMALPFKKAGIGILEPETVDSGRLVAFVPPRFFA